MKSFKENVKKMPKPQRRPGSESRWVSLPPVSGGSPARPGPHLALRGVTVRSPRKAPSGPLLPGPPLFISVYVYFHVGRPIAPTTLAAPREQKPGPVQLSPVAPDA